MLSMTHREAAIFDDACTVPTPCLLLPVSSDKKVCVRCSVLVLCTNRRVHELTTPVLEPLEFVSGECSSSANILEIYYTIIDMIRVPKPKVTGNFLTSHSEESKPGSSIVH